MTRCIIIPVDWTHPLARTELVSLEDFQRVIAGWIEPVTLDVECSLLIDENGRAKRLPINRRATLLVRLLVPDMRSQPALVGDALLLGAVTDEAFADVPSELERLLIEEHRFVVRATSGSESIQSTPFRSFWDACQVAIVADMAEALGDVKVTAFE